MNRKYKRQWRKRRRAPKAYVRVVRYVDPRVRAMQLSMARAQREMSRVLR